MHLTETLTHPQGDASSDTMLSFTGGLVQGWYAHAFHDTEPQLLRNWQNFEATKPFWEQKA